MNASRIRFFLINLHGIYGKESTAALFHFIAEETIFAKSKITLPRSTFNQMSEKPKRNKKLSTSIEVHQNQAYFSDIQLICSSLVLPQIFHTCGPYENFLRFLNDF